MRKIKAAGIHAHDSYKCGLLPPTPARPALSIEQYLTGVIPEHPASVDYETGIEFGMYLNNLRGVCGPASVANAVRMVTARLTGKMFAPSQEAVNDLYRRSGNPNFDPNTGADDNGVNMQVMLQALAAGGIDGKKPLGYARVPLGNIEVLKAVVDLFGDTLCGVLLQNAQQNQTPRGFWDYQPSAQWGGHAVMGGKYGPNGVTFITWAAQVEARLNFLMRQLSECWVVIWEEHLGNAAFQAGIDLQSLASDFEVLTGRPFPADAPPRPIPPRPTPAIGSRIIIPPGTQPGTYVLLPGGSTQCVSPSAP